MQVWLVGALLILAMAALAATRMDAEHRRQLEDERRQAEAAAELERDRQRLRPFRFAQYRERLEYVHEQLEWCLTNPANTMTADLDDWPGRAGEFADVLGARSESYHVLAAAYRGVAGLGRESVDPERGAMVLLILDRALVAAQQAIDAVARIAH